MAYSSCPISQTLLAQLMAESFMDERDLENIIKSTTSLMWPIIPMNGSKRQQNEPAFSLLVLDTMQNDENNTWFGLTKNYQEVKIDE